MKKKKPIGYSKERVVLSDTLPYETPIIFSNRYFYRFLTNFGVNFTTDNHIKWNKTYKDQSLASVIKILFGSVGEDILNYSIKLSDKQLNRVPFKYQITHKENDFRELALPHPKNQLEVISFYEEFKEMILYYCDLSSFSIRKPDKIAKFVYTNDALHLRLKGKDDDAVEDNSKEYESLKTFFTYKEYSNIYKFYEDYHYHRAEKKYDQMFKFDISKCFPSIYTHSIVWALFNKELVKDEIHLSKSTFAGRFDKLMQYSNYGETNGILVGPEFSRIFAELILQRIDKDVEDALKEENIKFKKDYEIYRYVDDFFVFHNNEETKNKIFELYKMKFSDYKLSINEVKTKFYSKPIITELTIAKSRIVELLDERLTIKINISDPASVKPRAFSKYISTFCDANYLITRFKIIIKETNVEYRDLVNYTLTLINNRLEKSIELFEEHYRSISKLEFKHSENLTNFSSLAKQKEEYSFVRYLLELLDFTSFIYTVSPRVNSTIKFSIILSNVIEYVKGNYRFKGLVKSMDGNNEIHKVSHSKRFNKINVQLIFKKIEDDISFVLSKNQMHKIIQIETLYLITVLRNLGRTYRLSEDQIAKYYKFEKIIKDGNDTGYYSIGYELNYFAITNLLFYIENITSFAKVKLALKESIKKKINGVDKKKRRNNTELIILLMDLLVCPFLEAKFKRELMTLYSIPKTEHSSILDFKNVQKYWFIKWKNFNLAKELNSKMALEPYS